MSQITTHILDTSRGVPACGVEVTLYQGSGETWHELSSGTTDDDGRVPDLLENERVLEAGMYKLRFEIGQYYQSIGVDGFYPFSEIVFNIQGDGQHYHVPLLLNPFGYSTYRGS